MSIEFGDKELKGLRQEIIDYKSENSSLRGENIDLRNKIKILTNNLNEYEKKNAELENREKNEENKYKNCLELAFDDASKIIQENENKSENLMNDILRLKEDNKNLNNQLLAKGTDMTNILNKNNLLMEKCGLLSKRLKEKNDKIVFLKETNGSLLKDVTVKAAEIDKLNKRINELEVNKDEFAKLEAENKSLKTQNSILKFINNSYNNKTK